MKTITLAIISLISSYSFAQEVPKIEVIETKDILNKETRDVFAVEVYGTDKGLIEKTVKDAFKDKDAKVSMKKEFFADNAVFKSFGDNNTVDIYGKIEPKTAASFLLSTAVDLGGAFLTKENGEEKTKAYKAFLYELAVKASKNAVLKEVKEAEKMLSKREKELKSLKENQADLEKDIKEREKNIEEAKRKIEQDKIDIKSSIEKQGAKQKELEAQRDVVKTLQLKEKAVK